MSHDAFLSYSSTDKPTADAVCSALEELGIRCWIAPRDILPGTDWSAAIIDAIGACRVFVLVFSSASNQSEQVKRELNTAVGNGKIIIPFRIEDVPLSKHMLYFIGTPHWLDALTAPLEKHITRLAESVSQILAIDAPGTALPANQAGGPEDGRDATQRRRATNGKQRFGPAVDLYETTRLSLQIPGSLGPRNVCLLRGPVVHLGKHRHNDIVLRVFPPSEENDALSLLISRHHAVLRVETHEAVWQNLDCPNGTIVGTRCLGPEERVVITQGVTVAPAGAIELVCDLCLDEGGVPADPYGEFERSVGDARGSGTFTTLGGSVRLRRSDALGPLEQYVVLDRHVLVGSNPLCSVLVAHPSVAGEHARIFWLGRSFWLEPCQTECPTLCDGAQIPADHLAPLRPGVRFRLGDVEISVAEHGQYYLDMPPPRLAHNVGTD